MNKFIKQTKFITRLLRPSANISNGSRHIASFNFKSIRKIDLNKPLLDSFYLFNLNQQIRNKKSNASKGKNSKTSTGNEEDSEDEYSDDEDNDHDEKENLTYINSIDTSKYHPGFKIVQKAVPSLRFDSVISVGLNLSRNKIEDYFYSSKLKLNGEKVTKKSAHVKAGDRLDMIGDLDEKAGKRAMKRVFIENVFEAKAEGKRPQAVLVIWKAGLFEEDSYKKHL